MQWLLLLLAASLYVGLPAALFTGWRRWMRRAPERKVVLSLPGFALASASAVLAIGTALYSVASGGFRYYAPSLLMIFKIGLLLSLGGLALALGGIWKRNPLRWHAPVVSLVTLLLWMFWIAGE